MSTGRGGAGNIGRDANVYAAGDITREGIEGVSADGEYSTGRGGMFFTNALSTLTPASLWRCVSQSIHLTSPLTGAGNIGYGDGLTPGTEERRRFSLFNRDASRSRSRSRARQGSRVRTDDVVVPETAMRSDDYKEYHTGVSATLCEQFPAFGHTEPSCEVSFSMLTCDTARWTRKCAQGQVRWSQHCC